jgi:ACS family hexuronate transporter-like MFS transporter
MSPTNRVATPMNGMRLWAPTVSMTLVSLISYIDRNTMALLAPTILKDTGLSGEQYGFIISAFSVAYMIGNPVWGILLDGFGLRKGMTAAVTFWSIAAAAHAAAGGMMSFAALRALLGFGEGATFPGGMRTAVQTLPPEKRSRGIAVAYSGGSLGAVVTPILVTPLAAYFGWRAAFLLTGGVGFAWLGLWFWISRGIASEDVKSSRTPRPSFADPRVWAFMAAYALGAIPLAFVLYSSAIFLSKARGLSQTQLGWLLWIPPLGWEVGYFFWGWISDSFRRPGHVSYRTLFQLLTICSIPLAFAGSIGALPLLMLEFFLAMFIASGFVILSIAYATDEFSSDHSGFLAGLGAGSWSAVVALVMPVFGKFFDQQQYSSAFALAAAIPIAGCAIWQIASRRRSSQA